MYHEIRTPSPESPYQLMHKDLAIQLGTPTMRPLERHEQIAAGILASCL